MNYFVHPQGICEASAIGEGTRIWAFAHILPRATIGRDCNICDHVFIENDVSLGDRVTVKCGVQLWDGITVEDDVFIGPNATFSNDAFPRSKQHQKIIPRTLVQKNASIGAGAIILPGITIGQNAMIGAGAVVTGSVQANAIVTGNPARVIGYVDATKSPSRVLPLLASAPEAAVVKALVTGVTLHRLKRVEDLRGNLAVGEFGREIPFQPRRYFAIFDVPSSRVRGEHALRTCEQFLVCVRGSCNVVVDDGSRREEIILDNPTQGLYVPAMTWLTLYKFASDTILTVFASAFYDPSDYIRQYEDFLALCGGAARHHDTG
jgi:UDP-2-acetamido-3-amino-2,3-dideoxy-glucuronate N-acetyltransferase